MSDPAREHILLTVLGIGPMATTYVLGRQSQASTIASAALYALLPEAERPDRILALCTPEAQQHSLPELRRCLEPQPCPIDVVHVSSEATDKAIHECLAALAKQVPSGAELTVDVTHGLRHLVFVTYAGVLYLTALRGVRLRAAYYGMLKRDGPTSPFFDVRPLVDLPLWFHALRVLKDTGSAHALADLVAVSGEQAGDARAALRTLSEAYASGLPIELGYLARQFLAEHSEWLEAILHRQRLPLAGELVDDFAGILATWQITQELPETGWKARVRLDRTELQRQARIIDGFLARDDYPTAFGLMREWLVLWAMWCTGEEHRWLNHHARKPTERLLRDLAELARRPDRASSDQAVIGQVWDDLRELRNAYAHHGLDKSVTLSTEDRLANRVRAVVRVWRETFRTVPKFSLRTPPPDGRVLVSPVGMRPGVLFSALRTAGPDRLSRCLVICSAQTVAAVGQACEAAGYSGDVRLLRLEDPFAGIAELEPRVREAKPYLLDAGEVFVNVTGGTTLMAVLAERIAGATRRDRSVYRFALVDRRPPAAQEADPYQHGDVCWLDEQPGSEQA